MHNTAQVMQPCLPREKRKRGVGLASCLEEKKRDVRTHDFLWTQNELCIDYHIPN